MAAESVFWPPLTGDRGRGVRSQVVPARLSRTAVLGRRSVPATPVVMGSFLKTDRFVALPIQLPIQNPPNCTVKSEESALMATETKQLRG